MQLKWHCHAHMHEGCDVKLKKNRVEFSELFSSLFEKGAKWVIEFPRLSTVHLNIFTLLYMNPSEGI